MKNKAQTASASAAATLIAVIAALVVLYIMFIPPEERAEILDTGGTTGSIPPSYNGDGENITLLLEYPGSIHKQDGKEIEHLIPSFSLSIKKEASILKSVQSLYVKRAVFTNRKENVTFNIADVENVENMLLNFYVKESSGRLIITLNNKEIYNSELEQGNIDPIKILKEDLINGENQLTFSASSIGIAFWRTHEYTLESVQITADLISKQGLTSENIFLVEQREKDNLDEIYLKFVPECEPAQVDKLDIEINGYNVYSAIPDCGTVTPNIYFSPEYVRKGENRITFKTQGGNYIIDLIKIMSRLKEARYPVYYFELDSELYYNITRTGSTTNASLILEFIDDVSDKRGIAVLNNHKIGFDVENKTYTKRINSYLEKGNNVLKLEPEDDVLDVVELKIIVREPED